MIPCGRRLLSAHSNRLCHLSSPHQMVMRSLAPSFCTARSGVVQPKTYEFQDKLPSLPVPPLHETCSRYLRSLEPFKMLGIPPPKTTTFLCFALQKPNPFAGILSPEEIKQTEQLVQQFQEPGGRGERLHQKLVQRSTQQRNWLEDWW